MADPPQVLGDPSLRLRAAPPIGEHEQHSEEIDRSPRSWRI
jgi:hypothetical protein